MNKEEILSKLEIFNDELFKFDSYKHKYTYNDEKYISVTQFISRFHKEFDSDYWSNIKSKERGITKEEILKEWKKTNDRANEIGTGTHLFIENYFKKIPQEIPRDLDIVDRINKFNIIYAKQLYKLIPIKFEQKIFSKKWKIAGMIDSIFLNSNNDIIILDYKTNKNFTTDKEDDGKWEKLLYPFNSFWKNHLNEYSIQLSLYSIILEEYGLKIKSNFLLHIGPTGEAKIYKSLDFREILLKFLEDYMGDLPF